MAVYSYQLADGSTRWFYVVDCPPRATVGADSARSAASPSQTAAVKAEREVLGSFRDASLAADGSDSAELEAWLTERELDVQDTTVANYRDLIRCAIATISSTSTNSPSTVRPAPIGSKRVNPAGRRELHAGRTAWLDLPVSRGPLEQLSSRFGRWAAVHGHSCCGRSCRGRTRLPIGHRSGAVSRALL
jgi:hypothetical protein